MSFLLDTNICSAHLKRPAGLMHRFIQHSGRLHIPTIVLGELYAWAHHRKDPSQVIPRIENDLLTDVAVLDFDSQFTSSIQTSGLSPRRLGNVQFGSS